MARKIFSVIGGLIIAMLAIFLIELIFHHFYPMPPDINMNNSQAFSEWLKTLPIGAYLIVLAAYFFGALFGGATATLICKQKNKMPIVVASILIVLAIVNFVMIPSPVWFVVATLLCYIPAALIGSTFSHRVLLGNKAAAVD